MARDAQTGNNLAPRRGLSDGWQFTDADGKAIDVNAQDHGEASPSQGAAGAEVRFDLARHGRGVDLPPRGRRKFL